MHPGAAGALTALRPAFSRSLHIFAFVDLGMEGARLRLHVGGGEADARFGGESAPRAAAPQHRPLPRPHHRPEQHHPLHRDGVLRRRRPGQRHRALHQGEVCCGRRGRAGSEGAGGGVRPRCR